MNLSNENKKNSTDIATLENIDPSSLILASFRINDAHVFKLIADLFNKWFQRFTFQFRSDGLHMEDVDISKTVTVILHIEKKQFAPYYKIPNPPIILASLESKLFKGALANSRKKGIPVTFSVKGIKDSKFYIETKKVIAIPILNLRINELTVDNGYTEDDALTIEAKEFQEIIKSITTMMGESVQFVQKNGSVKIFSENEEKVTVDQVIGKSSHEDFVRKYKTDVFKDILKLVNCAGKVIIYLNPKCALKIFIALGNLGGSFTIYVKDNDTLENESKQTDSFSDVNIHRENASYEDDE